MSELIGKDRQEILKELLWRLHTGEAPEALVPEFKEKLGDVSPLEIAQIEQELVRAGIPREEIRRLCEVHLALFRESLEEVEPLAPPWHPVHVLMAEHKHMVEAGKNLLDAAKALDGSPEKEKEFQEIFEKLLGTESHYTREENVLFPYLEKHGITEPPAVMWMEHDQIRGIKKAIGDALERSDNARLVELSQGLLEAMMSHFYKENHVLFPTAMDVIGEDEWPTIRAEFDDIGYCCITPPPMPTEGTGERAADGSGEIELPTGKFTVEELNAILNALPVDITFVDKNDTVRYFNESKGRIFVRTKAVLGRKVQNCHPQKSVHLVERILDDFKNKRRDVAEFWINFAGRHVYIRYFPMWNPDGEYLGVIEVTQDITDIKKLEGEKRLLDEG
ncbi:DUF438 domain-containing protein [Candidatus Bipolaricaulota bacterium]|nr:DUF438 domain-containing protein [Candidatus Bipolaricaulota bacterium]